MIKGCSHNDEVDASTPGHRHLRRQFIPYFLAHRLARKYEKMSPQAPLPLRLRHLIITVRPPHTYFNTYKYRINGRIILNVIHII